jgi:hypothetical protein
LKTGWRGEFDFKFYRAEGHARTLPKTRLSCTTYNVEAQIFRILAIHGAVLPETLHFSVHFDKVGLPWSELLHTETLWGLQRFTQKRDANLDYRPDGERLWLFCFLWTC